MSRLSLLALALAACAPSVGAVQAPVDRMIYDRIGVGVGDDSAIRLARPITRADAVVIAVAHHPRAAAARAALGIAAGELGRRRGLGHTELELEARLTGDAPALDVAVVHDVVELITAAPRRAAGEAQLAAAQARAASELLTLAARAELAWLDAAAAVAQRALAQDAFDTLAAAAELTERIAASGGTTELARARAASARALARAEVGRAEAAVAQARIALDDALGLSGDATGWALGDGLPALPPAPPALDDLEADAVAHSLAVVAAGAERRAAAGDARAAAIAAWLPGLAIGAVGERDGDGWRVGPALRIGVPLWSGDAGAAAAARARTAVARAHAAAVEVELRAAARAARVEALAAYQEARQLGDEVVPLTRHVVAELIRHYNAMNASPFELLAARRDQALAEQAALAARLRLARAEVVVAALRHGVTLAPAAPPSAPGAPATSTDSSTAH